jgi:hypothetical protein
MESSIPQASACFSREVGGGGPIALTVKLDDSRRRWRSPRWRASAGAVEAFLLVGS